MLLLLAIGLAAALSTASGLLLVISSSVAHDIYYCMINPNASETQRVFVGRIIVRLAATSFFPAIVLGIFDQRTNREGAIAGITVGLLFTLLYIVEVKFYGMPPWLFGISPEGIGTVGMLINFVVTLVVSRLTPPPPLTVQEMVKDLRSPVSADLLVESVH